MKPSFALRRFLVACSLLALPSSHAADGTWTQTTAGPFDWGTLDNWNGAIGNGADSTAYFTPNITVDQTVNLETARTIGNIIFTDSTTSSHNLIISGVNTLTLDRSSGVPVIDVTQSGRTLTLSSVIAGNDGLQKTGLGTLTLNGSAVNTFTGGVNVSGGRLALDFANLGTPTNLINSANTLIVAGGTFSIAGKNATGTTSQSFAGTTLGPGLNTLSMVKGASATSATLDLGALTILAGSVTLLDTGSTYYTTGAVPTDNIFTTTGINGAALPVGTTTGSNAGLFMRLTDGAAGRARYVSLSAASGGKSQLLPVAVNGTPLTATTPTNMTDASTIYTFSNAGGTLNTGAQGYALYLNQGTTGRTLTIANGSTLTLNGINQIQTAATTTIAAQAGGYLVIGSEKNLVINVDNTGGTVISAPISNNGSSGGAGGTASSVTISSTISSGTPGAVTLSGANTYTGATFITGGTLVMNTSNLIPNSSKIAINGGAKIDFSTAAAVNFVLTDGQDVEGFGSGTATFNTGNNATSGVITTGNSLFSHTGTGTLALQRLEIRGSGNEMTGGNIQAGVANSRRGLIVGNSAGGAATFTISGGTFTSIGGSLIDLIGVNGVDGTLAISGGNYVNTGTLSIGLGATGHPGGTLNIHSGSATIGTLIYNANSIGGQGIVNLNNGGTLTLGTLTSTSGATREFNFNGGQFVAGGSVTFDNTLTLNVKDNGAKIDTAANSVAVSGNLVNFGGTSIGGLTKTGVGALTLTGTNTYSGATTINGGTLALGATGSIDNTSGLILGGGTFDVSAKIGGYSVDNVSGNGTVVGTLTVSTQLDIGTSPGTITFEDLTLEATTTLLYDITGGGTTADLGLVSGTLDLGGAVLDLVQLGTYTQNDKFTLFGYQTGSLTGTFDSLANGAEFTDAGGLWKINYFDSAGGLNGGTGTSFVTITAIPEPQAALLGGLGFLFLLRRRR